MKRILIADDEPRQCNGLAKLIQSLRPDLTVLTASNGKEAFETARQDRPDAVLTDIRMPFSDGFDFCEKLLTEMPDMVVAFVSAHEEFDYATRALRIGAVEYLLKPYTVDQVETTLRSLEHHVDKRRQSTLESMQMNSAIEAWRQSQLSALLTRELTQSEKSAILEFFPLNSKGCLLLLQMLNIPDERKEQPDRMELREKLREILVRFLPNACVCTLSDDNRSLIAILPIDNSMNENDEILKAMLLDIKLSIPEVVLVCRSCHMQNIGLSAYRAMEEVKFLAGFSFYYNRSCLLAYEELSKIQFEELPYSGQYERQIFQQIMELSEDGLAEAIKSMLCSLNPEESFSPEKFLRGMEQIARAVVSNIKGRMSSQSYAALMAKLASVFDNPQSYSAFRENFLHLMQFTMYSYGIDDGKSSGEFVQDIIAYIQKNVHLPLTLATLSERFYFSPNYLSCLIKQRTGKPFKQYILSLRMEVAIEHLMNSDEKVVNIARFVGFSDSAHFNRIFKKQQGVSPDTFRRRMKNR